MGDVQAWARCLLNEMMASVTLPISDMTDDSNLSILPSGVLSVTDSFDFESLEELKQTTYTIFIP
jgi:pSer/pThr/pTyr-binding forkhead associated (FHA) protein